MLLSSPSGNVLLLLRNGFFFFGVAPSKNVFPKHINKIPSYLYYNIYGRLVDN